MSLEFFIIGSSTIAKRHIVRIDRSPSEHVATSNGSSIEAKGKQALRDIKEWIDEGGWASFDESDETEFRKMSRQINKSLMSEET